MTNEQLPVVDNEQLPVVTNEQLLAGTNEELALNDVTLVLIARGANAGRMERWLAAIGDDPSLGHIPLILWHAPDATEVVEAATADVDGVYRAVQTEGEDGHSIDDVDALLREVSTKHFVIAPMTRFRRKTLHNFKKRVRKARRLVPEAETPAENSLLLATSTCPRPILVSYLSVMIGRERSVDPAMNDYLGFLAMRTAVGSVEGVDVQPDGMQVLARLNFGALDLPASPPWRFVISLLAPDGGVIDSQPAALKERVSMYGDLRWEYATASIPLTAAATGEYRVVVSLATDLRRLATRRDLRPNVGALLPARTVRLTVGKSARRVPVKYLIHATGDAKVTRVKLQRGGGSRSAATWSKSLVKKDLKFIAKRGAPRQMRLLRLIRLATTPLVGRRQIWLVGERVGTAQDNGFHLFKYLRTEHPQRRIYYVIDKESSQYDRVSQFGYVINHSSLRHRMLMLHAAVLADAYSISYLIPRQWNRDHYARHLAWRIGALRVYLKHGVHMSPNALKRGTTGYDMILTAGQGETAALAAASGYGNQLTEVGLPRYDALSPTEPSRTVLFMSTWRRYLVPKVFGGENKDQTAYEGSTYERFMASFLKSERLQTLLEGQGYRLVFLPHHNLATHFKNFSTGGDRITIANTDSNTFQDLIRECDVFLTDHSSVSFDIAYLGTPMVYARFDRDEFERRHVAPSWFDHERGGFGPVTYDLADTLKELERILERNCEQDELYARRIEATFTYRDQGNCRRTVAAIDSLLAQNRQGA